VKVSLRLPTDRVDRVSEFVTGPAVAEMARLAESVGFDAVHVTDHPAPDGRWLDAGGHYALDPFVVLGAAAAATERLLLQTQILVLAYRNPLLAANSIGSLQLLSGGRLLLGVAAGYLRPEFAAVGVDFDARNARLDEAIDTVRAVLRGAEFAGAGDGWSARGVRPLPAPAGGPACPPIWIGGNSTAAIRRAVDRGDGWVPFPNPPELGRAVRTAAISSVADLAARLDVLRAYAAERGRTEPLDVCFSPFGSVRDPARFADEVAELAALGVTWLCVGPDDEPAGARPDARPDARAAWCAAVEAMAPAVALAHAAT
jgi:probable F420-dependent oxidoreductase